MHAVVDPGKGAPSDCNPSRQIELPLRPAGADTTEEASEPPPTPAELREEYEIAPPQDTEDDNVTHTDGGQQETRANSSETTNSDETPKIQDTTIASDYKSHLTKPLTRTHDLQTSLAAQTSQIAHLKQHLNDAHRARLTAEADTKQVFEKIEVAERSFRFFIIVSLSAELKRMKDEKLKKSLNRSRTIMKEL